MSIQNPVVVCWTSQSFRHLAKGLEIDCTRLGYQLRIFDDDAAYRSSVIASYRHPSVIRQALNEYERILFLDAECRLLRPIPDNWDFPTIAVKQPTQKFWIKYNSGTMLLDQTAIPWVDTWIETIRRWNFDSLDDDDFIQWPGDISDELALHAAVAAHQVYPHEIALEYVDRTRAAPIARGLWTNASTVIQHPTIHHWPQVDDPIESKKLFIQNYPTDPAIADTHFSRGSGTYAVDGWIFDATSKTYAPEEHFEDHARAWIDHPVQLTAAQR